MTPWGLPYNSVCHSHISTDAGESNTLTQTDLAKVRYPEKALKELRTAAETVRVQSSAESQVALFEAIIVMVKALAMTLTLRVSRSLTQQVSGGGGVVKPMVQAGTRGILQYRVGGADGGCLGPRDAECGLSI